MSAVRKSIKDAMKVTRDPLPDKWEILSGGVLSQVGRGDAGVILVLVALWSTGSAWSDSA